jgi:hypothetical protein
MIWIFVSRKIGNKFYNISSLDNRFHVHLVDNFQDISNLDEVDPDDFVFVGIHGCILHETIVGNDGTYNLFLANAKKIVGGKGLSKSSVNLLFGSGSFDYGGQSFRYKKFLSASFWTSMQAYLLGRNWKPIRSRTKSCIAGRNQVKTTKT